MDADIAEVGYCAATDPDCSMCGGEVVVDVGSARGIRAESLCVCACRRPYGHEGDHDQLPR